MGGFTGAAARGSPRKVAGDGAPTVNSRKTRSLPPLRTVGVDRRA